MQYRAPLTALALSFTALAAQAQPVELVFDVQATARTTSESRDGVSIDTADLTFQAQRFNYVVRFDLGEAFMQPDTLEVSEIKAISGAYRSGSTSLTPFTEQVLAGLPERSTALIDYDGMAYYRLSVPTSATAQAPAPVSQQLGLSSIAVWFSNEGIAAYSRGVNLTAQGSPLGAEQLTVGWSGEDMVSFLRAQLGVKHSGAFLEESERPGEQSVAVTDALGLVHFERVQTKLQITGDATLMSITVVPEPATCALMGLGLVGVAAVARRQRSA